MDVIIKNCYNKILNRDPDDDGVATYEEHLKKPHFDLERVLKSSEEYDVRIRCKKFINVFMCVRNNARDLPSTFDVLERIRRKDDAYEYWYYIFENDSDDDTVELCETFMAKNNGVFHRDVLNKKQWGDVKDFNRVRDMAIYRNKCKELCSLEHLKRSEFCVLVDTKVTFGADIIDRYVRTMNDESIAMVTPFGKVGKKPVYYDTYALEQKVNKRITMNSGLIEVVSACGGIFMVRSEAFIPSYWKGIEANKSEHNAFCYSVNNFGKIVVDTSIHTEWVK